MSASPKDKIAKTTTAVDPMSQDELTQAVMQLTRITQLQYSQSPVTVYEDQQEAKDTFEYTKLKPVACMPNIYISDKAA